MVASALFVVRPFRQRRTLSLHDVPDGRQYNKNETIAFFAAAWDVFALD
jgi:hypothetical protein